MKKNIILIIAIILMCSMFSGCKFSDYKNALKDIDNGNYSEAIQLLDNLGNYRDSENKLISTIDEYATILIRNDRYDEVIDLYSQHSSLSDYSSIISNLESEKELFDVYNEAKDLFSKGSFKDGMKLINTLPEEYRNVRMIRISYNHLLKCPFDGKYICGMRQMIKFNPIFDSNAEKFKLHAYKAVYWSDGVSVYKDYDFDIDYIFGIDSNLIKISKFEWTMKADGKIYEDELGETHVYVKY